MFTVDLNVDMGEGFPNDLELMKYATSVNIACGFHAGDIDTMTATVEAALENGLAIGAHPSFPDRANFGRLPMKIDQAELITIICEQINSLQDICLRSGAKLSHVKPHGALYNQAAIDHETSISIVSAINSIDPALAIFGLSGSVLMAVAKEYGSRTVSEVFADRGYNADGTLVTRGKQGAMIDSADESAMRVTDMIKYGRVRALTGEMISILAETVCLHGDTPDAVSFAATIRKKLEDQNIAVKSQYNND